MVHLHLPSKKTIKKDLHFVESKIIKPVYSDVIKPTLTLPVQALRGRRRSSTNHILLSRIISVHPPLSSSRMVSQLSLQLCCVALATKQGATDKDTMHCTSSGKATHPFSRSNQVAPSLALDSLCILPSNNLSILAQQGCILASPCWVAGVRLAQLTLAHTSHSIHTHGLLRVTSFNHRLSLF